MGAWIYIIAGVIVFIIGLSALILMSVSDDWGQVNSDENYGEGWDGK